MIINIKKIVVSVMVVYFGFLNQNLNATTYQLGQEDLISKSQYMNKLAPEFENISDKWRVVRASEIKDSNYPDHFQLIVGFPGQYRTSDETKREYQNYRPMFDSEDSINLLGITRAEDGFFMDNHWAANGLSSHAIISRDGTLFIHADILKNEKGQMLGKHNKHSLEVAFVDNGDKTMSQIQMEAIKALTQYVSAKNPSKISFTNAASIYEIKQTDGEPGFESGEVTNMAVLRVLLNLEPYKAS